jgi:glycosyltransferase involved in cell wall biosynthesis
MTGAMRRDLQAPRSAVILEPETGGHQREWLEHIIRFCHLAHPSCSLWLVVAPSLRDHLAELIPQEERPRVRVLAVTEREQRLCTHASLTIASFARIWVMRRFVRLTQAEAAHFLAIDLPGLPLALGWGIAGRPVSGILFRPSVHYPALGSWRLSLTETVRDLRKAAIYRALLNRRLVESILTLDPYFVAYASTQYPRGNKVRALADPAHPALAIAAADRALADTVPKDRIIFLLFGYIAERKGALVLLESLRLLPRELAGRIAVVLAGRIEDAIRSRIAACREQLGAERPELWCAIEDRWMQPGEIEALVERCDVVLIPYQRFVGSSGVLLWAARAGKPALAQQFGLIGRLVADHRLGLGVDTSDAVAVAAGITRMIEEGPRRFIDIEAAQTLAASQVPRDFARSVLVSVFGEEAVKPQDHVHATRECLGPPSPRDKGWVSPHRGNAADNPLHRPSEGAREAGQTV